VTTTSLQPPRPPASSGLPHASTIADLLERLDGIPAERIRLYPYPGTATVDDVVAIEAEENRLYELIDGVLVEKPMGMRESILAIKLGALLLAFVEPRRLGVVAGADGMMQLKLALVRIPDVAFIAWNRFAGRRVPSEPAPLIAPDLAIEILSPSNTKREMARKLREYFEAGALLVWYIDPNPRTVAVYVRPDDPTVLTENDVISGGAALPGFTLPLRELFAVLDATGDTPDP
jgi:Uma2 family endonuclease